MGLAIYHCRKLNESILYLIDKLELVINRASVHRNNRRIEAFADAYSAISLICIVFAVQNMRVPQVDMSTELRIKPRYFFNFDAVTSVIGEVEDRPVYLPESARKTLKELKLGVSAAFSCSSAKRRGIKQLYLTSADGWLLVAVIIIRDNNIKKICFQHLSNDGGYQTWLMLLPNVRGTAANNLVSIFLFCCLLLSSFLVLIHFSS